MLKKASILIAAFVLGSFAVGGVGLVAMTHGLTDARIAENQREAMLAKFRAILPAGRIGNDPLNDRIEVAAPDLLGGPSTEVYRVRDQQGAPVAVVLRPIVPDGYAGPIKLLVAVLTDGTLGGVRVIEHHETPGLGDKIEERKDDWIIRQFADKSLRDPTVQDWEVKRDGGVFDQFTGATITPRSIVHAVRNTLLFVEREGERLYQQSGIGAPAAPTTTAAAAPADAGPVPATAPAVHEPVSEPSPEPVSEPAPAPAAPPAATPLAPAPAGAA